MQVKPLQDRVLILPEEEKTSGLIQIPDAVKEKPVRGRIIAVGTDETLQELVKVGDVVVYGKYAGEQLDVDNVKHLIVSMSDLLSVIC